MADLENIKWRYLTEAEKKALREIEDDEDDGLDPDEVIEWRQLNLDTAIIIFGKVTPEEFARIHSYVYDKWYGC